MNAIHDLRLRYSLILITLGCWTIAESARADAPSEAGAAVKDLLEIGWRTSPDARGELDQRFAAIPLDVQSDARVSYAYALALIKLRRETEAARVIEELAAAEDPPLGVLRARLWLAMLTRQYDAALVQMERLAKRMGQQATEPPSAEHREMARRQGMMIGFLEGPAQGRVPPARLADYLAKIMAELPTRLAASFAEGRQAIGPQHAQWLTQQTAAEEQAEQQAEAERQRLFESATTERDQIAVRRRELMPELQKLREELGSELESLRASERPLAEQFSVAVFQLRRVQDELRGVLDEIARLKNLLPRTQDPERRRLLLDELDQLERIATRIRFQVDQSKRDAAVLESRVLEIRQRAEATQVRYGREIAARESDLQTLGRRESQLTGMEQRAARLKSARGKSHLLGARAAALTTYITFPLEEEKERLLASR